MEFWGSYAKLDRHVYIGIYKDKRLSIADFTFLDKLYVTSSSVELTRIVL